MSLTSSRRFLLACMGIAFMVSLSVPSMAQCAEETIVQKALDGMRGFKKRFVAHDEWLVEYTHNRDYFELPPGFKPNMTQTKVTNACKGDRWYLLHLIETKKRPLRVEASWADRVCAHRVGAALSILPDIHPNIFERCFYTNTLFLNVHPKTKFNTDILSRIFAASPNGAFPNGLPDSVEARLNEYAVRPAEEPVDGSSCIVLTRDNRDTLWIDCHYGGVCRRRIEYFPSGGIAVEYKNERLKQFSEDLWLPQHQEVARYNGDDAPAKMRGKIRYIERNDLVKVQFGNIPNAIFNIEPSYPGFVNDHVRGVIYNTQPKDAQPESVLANAASEARARSGAAPVVNWNWSLAFAANVCTISALVLVFQIRRARKGARRHS